MTHDLPPGSHRRQGALDAVIPNNPSQERSNIRSTSISTPSATWWSVVSQNSSNSAVLRPASSGPARTGRAVARSRSHHLMDAISVHTT